MRIRSTKPEFWRSERIASVDWEHRLLLKGLESYVDDNGVGKEDVALIIGDLFQRDMVREPSRTVARVSEGISALHQAGLIHRYEVEGTRLLYISFWESVQRIDKPQDGRFPRPDGTFNYKESIIREPVANPREESRTLAPGTGEQGNRGTGEQGIDISPVSPVTNALKSAGDLDADDLIGLAAQAGITDLDDIRSTLQRVIGSDITRFDALVFSEDLGKLAIFPVENLGGFVATACRDTPDDIRTYWAQYEAETKGAA